MSASISKKNLAVIIISVILIAIILFVALNIDSWISQKDYLGEDQRIVEFFGEEYIPKDIKTILVFGIDTDEQLATNDSFYNTDQADFLALIAIDKENESFSVLQINRDTMTQIDELSVTGARSGNYVTEQIALAHTYGDGGEASCKNTVRAVSRLLFNTDIDGYIALSMGAVGELNDYVGGVEVTMPDDYTVLDGSFTKGAVVNLMGDQALRFVRARSSVDDGTNIARMERQKIYMDAFIAKMKTVTVDDSFIKGAYDKVSDSRFVLTDCSFETLQNLCEGIGDYTCSGIYTPEGEAVIKDVYMEFTVDNEKLMKLVSELYYEKY